MAIETLSKIASTATLERRFCSERGMPNFSKVSIKVGSTSSRLLSFSFLGELQIVSDMVFDYFVFRCKPLEWF